MNRNEFLRRARRYARRNGMDYHFDQERGKGSHGTLYLGNFLTRVQHGEIPHRTLLAMLRQLGINRRDF